MDVVFLHFIAAVSLFVVINWIGAHSKGFGYLPLGVLATPDEAPAFNVVFRVLAPVVGITLMAAALYAVNLDRFVEGIWLIAVYYLVFRFFFNIARGRTRLLNWPSQAGIAAATVLLAYWTYQTLLHDRASVLPEFGTFANELWILILLFMYHVANGIKISDTGTRRRKQHYLADRLRNYSRKYGDIVEATEPFPVPLLAYAVLIYETFNRPAPDRWIEKWVLFPVGLAKTLGPMQVTTSTRISDRESVRAGVHRLSVDYLEALETAVAEYDKAMAAIPEGPMKQMMERLPSAIEDSAIRATLFKYNPDGSYVSEVYGILQELKELRPDLVSVVTQLQTA
jgi:hypothetical protein